MQLIRASQTSFNLQGGPEYVNKKNSLGPPLSIFILWNQLNVLLKLAVLLQTIKNITQINKKNPKRRKVFIRFQSIKNSRINKMHSISTYKNSSNVKTSPIFNPQKNFSNNKKNIIKNQPKKTFSNNKTCHQTPR
jgi:hypothetical protein